MILVNNSNYPPVSSNVLAGKSMDMKMEASMGKSPISIVYFPLPCLMAPKGKSGGDLFIGGKMPDRRPMFLGEISGDLAPKHCLNCGTNGTSIYNLEIMVTWESVRMIPC